MEVIQFRGRTAPYLEPAPGKASLNVLKLARNGLGIELRTLLSAAMKKSVLVRKNGIPFDSGSHKRILNLCVSPLGQEGSSREERYFLVLFEDARSHGNSGSKDVSRRRTKGRDESEHEIARLKRELADAQDAV